MGTSQEKKKKKMWALGSDRNLSSKAGSAPDQWCDSGSVFPLSEPNLLMYEMGLAVPTSCAE